MEVLEILGIIVIVLDCVVFSDELCRGFYISRTPLISVIGGMPTEGFMTIRAKPGKLPGGIPEGSGGMLWNRTGYPVVKRQDSCGFS